MLYISTRSKMDSFTMYRALHEKCAPDGGAYVPFRLVPFLEDSLQQMKAQSFGETVAQILNYFFSARLTGWDIDFSVGRNPLKIRSIGQKVHICELWHTEAAAYGSLENSLYALLGGTAHESPTAWARISIAVAILFATFAQLKDADRGQFDISCPVEDYLWPVAAIYAKKLGLPLGKIIIACAEEDLAWDFVQHGVLGCKDGSCDISGPERIVFDALGIDGVNKYLEAAQKGRACHFSEEERPAFSNALSATVLGKDRMDSVVRSVIRTSDYTLSADAAAAYGGLQDHRATTGEHTDTVIFSTRRAAR